MVLSDFWRGEDCIFVKITLFSLIFLMELWFYQVFGGVRTAFLSKLPCAFLIFSNSCFLFFCTIYFLIIFLISFMILYLFITYSMLFVSSFLSYLIFYIFRQVYIMISTIFNPFLLFCR